MASTGRLFFVDRWPHFPRRVHKKYPFRGEKPLRGTAAPQTAPLVWTGGRTSPSTEIPRKNPLKTESLPPQSSGPLPFTGPRAVTVFKGFSLHHLRRNFASKMADFVAKPHLRLNSAPKTADFVAKPLLHHSYAPKLAPFGAETKRGFRFRKPLFVIRLGLEPRTPTLKVLCSTC